MLNPPLTGPRPRRLRRQVAAAFLATGLVGGIVAVGTEALPQSASTAEAADIDVTITNLTVIPTTANVFTDLKIDFDYSVPDSTTQGDSFTLLLPAQFDPSSFPGSFEIEGPDGAGGLVRVATATITGSLLTVTFDTNYVDINNDVEGTVFFESNLLDDTAPSVQTLTFTESDSTIHTQDVTVVPFINNAADRTGKRAYFTNNANQCRNGATNCIVWEISGRAGPWTTVNFVDRIEIGQTISCDSFQFFTGVRNLTTGVVTGLAGFADVVTNACDEDGFDVTFNNVPPGRVPAIRVRATPDAPSPNGGVLFRNTVDANYNNSELVDSEVPGRRRSSALGGTGTGDNLTLRKEDANGNNANTIEEQVLLPSGATKLVYRIVNSGATALDDVVMTDVVTRGSATVSNFTCNFSQAAAGAPTTGTTWVGPFPPGTEFTCTADLAGVTFGDPHTNVATVSAVGSQTGRPVNRTDPYNAEAPDDEEVPGTGSVSVGDFVFNDVNRDGRQDAGDTPIPGVTLTISQSDASPVVDLEGDPVTTTATDSNGLYSFDNLPALPAGQSYIVTITSPAGYAPTTAGVGDRAGDSSTGSAASGDLINDGDEDLTLDFGFVVIAEVPGTGSVSVGDFVFVDVNRDGRQDAGDTPIPGVTLTISQSDASPVVDLDGDPVTTTATDSNGLYSFDNLPALPAGQSYIVTVTSPAGYAPTTAGVGDRAGDSSTGSAASGDLINDGDEDLTLDFGFVVIEDAILPATGSNNGVLLLIGALLIGLGGVFIGSTRRRSATGRMA